MSYYEKWQLDKYGNVIAEDGYPEDENGLIQREQNDKWMEEEVYNNLKQQEF